MSVRRVSPARRNIRLVRAEIHVDGNALFHRRSRCVLATSLGFISVLVGIILAVWFTLGKIYGFSNAEVGWTSIMTSIIFFGGVQLLTVGVLGQYVGILFDEIKARPEYIIDEKKNY